MSEDRNATILIKQYQRLIENINKRTSINQKAIKKFKSEFRNRPLVMNVKVVKDLFEINTDALRLQIYGKGIKDLQKHPNNNKNIKKEVTKANADINKGISPRRREMNLAINQYRKNMNKKYDHIICSACGIEIKENKIACDKCAKKIGINEKVINFCDKCGKKVPKGSKFCQSCGKSL